MISSWYIVCDFFWMATGTSAAMSHAGKGALHQLVPQDTQIEALLSDKAKGHLTVTFQLHSCFL